MYDKQTPLSGLIVLVTSAVCPYAIAAFLSHTVQTGRVNHVQQTTF